MKRIFLFVAVSFSLVFAQSKEYQQNGFLFCLNKDQPLLSVVHIGSKLSTGIEAIDRLIERNGIISIRKWLSAADARDVVDGVDLSKIYEAKFANRQELERIKKIIRQFRDLPQIHSAALQTINHLRGGITPYEPNDPDFFKQWYIKKIGADKAWALWGDAIPGDSTVLVGVVDTGVDYLHPDLAGMLYVNPKERPGDANGDGKPGIAGVDDDGDGKIDEDSQGRQPGDPGYNNDLKDDDDENGFNDDFTGWDFADEDNDVRPPNVGSTKELSHGTHVSGIIAAVTDNQIGIAGISFRSKIIATKQARDTDQKEPGIVKGYSGILYCAKMGAKIINCSWGGGYDFYGKIVIDNVVNNYGAIVLCAAGNDNHDNDSNHQYPSDFANATAIAALNNADRRAYYSNWGNVIDFSAPGGEGGNYTNAIYSTIHANAGSYASWQGTSMATPVATGAFALLRAWFPQKDRNWLLQTMRQSADNIDDLNPSYAGKLGAGRVNIYKAIAKQIAPDITITNKTFTIDDANEDGQINPGESVGLVVNLENSSGWQDATALHLILRSSSPFIEIIDSLADPGPLNNGQSTSNSGHPLQFRVLSNAPYGSFDLQVHIFADDTAGYPYHSIESISVSATLNQTGFPVDQVSVSSAIGIGRFNGQPLIAAITHTDQLSVFRANGQLVEGFPKDIGTTTAAPVIADVDGDGQNEIVVVNRSGQIFIYSGRGVLKKRIDLNEAVQGGVAVSNLDDDPQLEMVIGTMRRTLHVIKSDSTELPGFPKTVSNMIDKGIALADMDGDGRPEMIFGTFDGLLQVIDAAGDTINDFPLKLDGKLAVPPVIFSGHIYVATTHNELLLVNPDTTISWKYPFNGKVQSALALCDVTGDGQPEIFLTTDDGALHGVNPVSGQSLAGFPVFMDGYAKIPPVFADLNNDGQPEIMVGTNSGKLYILEADGSNYAHFPAVYNQPFSASPALYDLDHDGDLELLIGTNNDLYAFDLPDTSASLLPWRTFMGSNLRTGSYAGAISKISSPRPNPIVSTFQLDQNYPNPFGSAAKGQNTLSTTIGYRLPALSRVRLTIYNILGQKVKILVDGKQEKGHYRVPFRAEGLASGVYIYQIRVKGLLGNGHESVQRRKMIFLR